MRASAGRGAATRGGRIAAAAGLAVGVGFLVSDKARFGFVPKGQLDALSLRAKDQEWSYGEGAVVGGPSEALAMAVSGRRAALADLEGDGVRVLAQRLSSRA